MNIPLILFWPFYIGSHNAIFSQFASKHKTSVTFFSSSFSDSWMLPKLVAFYSLHRTCTRSRQNLPCYAHRMVGMHNAYLPTCRGLGVGTMFLFLNPLTYLCSGRPPLGPGRNPCLKRKLDLDLYLLWAWNVHRLFPFLEHLWRFWARCYWQSGVCGGKSENHAFDLWPDLDHVRDLFKKNLSTD